jgi:IS5 family transposase
MKQRGAIKNDLLASDHRRQKLDQWGDPWAEIEACVDFVALAAEGDRLAPRRVSPQGGRPPFPTETRVRILVLKRLNHHADEPMELPWLDRMSYQRLCGLSRALNIPDRTTVWTFENRIGEAGAKALFDGVSAQRLQKGFIARGGQIIDATRVPAPQRKISRDEKALIEQQAMPTEWTPAPRRQKDGEATWTQKHGGSHFGYQLSVNVDRKYKVIRMIETDTARTQDRRHFDQVFDAHHTRRDVHADRGYPSEAREVQLQEAGYRNHIQRKGTRNRPLSECQPRRNRRIAKRARESSTCLRRWSSGWSILKGLKSRPSDAR